MTPPGPPAERESASRHPLEPPDQALAGALLPVLLHRIRNTTQLVTGVNAVLALDDPAAAGPLSAARGEDLAQASREAEELGWLLAVLSGGLGADLAGGRLEPGGLASTLQLVREALRRGGRELALGGPWPRLASAARGAALCLTAAELVWRAGSAAEAAEVGCERDGEGWQLWMRCEAAQQLEHPLRESARRLPEARLAVDAAGWVLRLPAGWLAPAREPRGP